MTNAKLVARINKNLEKIESVVSYSIIKKLQNEIASDINAIRDTDTMLAYDMKNKATRIYKANNLYTR